MTRRSPNAASSPRRIAMTVRRLTGLLAGWRGPLLVLGCCAAVGSPLMAQRPGAALGAPSGSTCGAKPQSLDVQPIGPEARRPVQVQAMWCRTVAQGTRIEVAFRGDTQTVLTAKSGCGTQSPCAVVDAETLTGNAWRAMIDRSNGMRVVREEGGKAVPVGPADSRIQPGRRSEGTGQWRAAFVLDSTLRVREIVVLLPGGLRLRVQPPRPATPSPLLHQPGPGVTPPSPATRPTAARDRAAPRDAASSVATFRPAPPGPAPLPPPRRPAGPLQADTGSSAARTALLPWDRTMGGTPWGLPPEDDRAPTATRPPIPTSPATSAATSQGASVAAGRRATDTFPLAPTRTPAHDVLDGTSVPSADTVARVTTWGLPPAQDSSRRAAPPLWDLPPDSLRRSGAHFTASVLVTAATPVDGRVPARGGTISLGGTVTWQAGSRRALLQLAPPPSLLSWAPFQPDPNRRFAVILDDARPEFRPWRTGVGTLLWYNSWSVDATGGLLAIGDSAGRAPWRALGTVSSLGQASGVLAEIGQPDHTLFSLRTTGLRDAVPSTLRAVRFPWRTLTSAGVHLGTSPVTAPDLPATWGATAVYHHGVRLGETAAARDGAALFVGGPIVGPPHRSPGDSTPSPTLAVRVGLERYATALHLVSPAYSPWEGTQRAAVSLEWTPPASRGATSRLRVDSDWLGRLTADTTPGGLVGSPWPAPQEWHLRLRWGTVSPAVVRPWAVTAGLDSYRYGALIARAWPRAEVLWTPWRRAARAQGGTPAASAWAWAVRAHAEQTPLFATGARGRVLGGTTTFSHTATPMRGWLLLAGLGQAWQCGAPLPMGIAWTPLGTLQTPGTVTWPRGCRPATNTGGVGGQAWTRTGSRLRWEGEVRWWRDAGTIPLTDERLTPAPEDGAQPLPGTTTPLSPSALWSSGAPGIPLSPLPVWAARGQLVWGTPWGATTVGRILWQRGAAWHRYEAVLLLECPWRRAPWRP